MKRSLVLLVVVSLSIFLSCRKVIGEGPVVTETRTVGNFTGISFETSGNVNFSVGSQYKVELQAQRNILDVLQTNIVNGVLHIDFKGDVRVKTHEDIIVNIIAPYADYFRLSGNGDMNIGGPYSAQNLSVMLSGSGNIYFQTAAVTEKIDAKVSGSGNISILDGSAINEDLDITGSGNIELGGVVVQNATTHTSGSGDMKLSVSKKLDVNISGSGSVFYHGNPIISTHISGSGRVIPF
jgi:hypothetical protein